MSADEFARPGARFGIVDTDVVRNPRLTARAVRLYVVLCTWAPGHGHRSVWPLRATLAEVMGASVDTVDRGLRELEEVGLLTITTRDKTSSVYTLHDLHDLPANLRTKGLSSAADGSQMCDPGGLRSEAQNSTNEQTMNMTSEQQSTAGAVDQLPGMPESPRAKRMDPVTRLAKEWWEAQTPRPAGRQAWPATTKSIAAILRAGHSEEQVRLALRKVTPPLSIGRIEIALNASRSNGHTPPSDFSNGKGFWSEDR